MNDVGRGWVSLQATTDLSPLVCLHQTPRLPTSDLSTWLIIKSAELRFQSVYIKKICLLSTLSKMSPTPAHLNFITGNKNKLAEVQAILAGVIELRNENIDLVEIQGSVEDVTTDKARRAAEAIKGPVLVEDTCLCFKAMNDLPGPYIKWFMQSLGAAQMHKLLAGFDDKSAQAVCTFAYCEGPGHEPVLFQGRTDGKLVESRGPTAFGWDSCFEYNGQTYAEMDKSEKNKISHRGKALEKLKEWLAQKVDA
ncbi:inosine triphosphate pyrophosphatase [Parastagonospora nodorum]|nr:inosine triphosphate pyrophosphatase [Parastagonospora nodorum]